MKKLISILLAVLLIMSVSVTAFASTEDEALSEIELQIKEAVYREHFEERYPETSLEDIEIFTIGNASDRGIYFRYIAYGFATTDVYQEKSIGNYYYDYTSGDEIYRFMDNDIVEIKEAYDNGIINDVVIAELSTMTSSVYPQISENGLDSRIEKNLKNRIYNQYFDYDDPLKQEKISAIKINYYGTASDGNLYIGYTIPDIEASDEILKYTIGDYFYNTTFDTQVYFCEMKAYGLGEICTIKEAYDNGLIEDEMLEEVSDLNFGLVKASEVTEPITTEPETTVATDETMQETTVSETSSTDATSATKTAVEMTTQNSDNSNGAVQTGQSNYIVIVLLLIITLSAIVFIKQSSVKNNT